MGLEYPAMFYPVHLSLFSGGFISSRFGFQGATVEPAYFWGRAKVDVRPFYSDRIRLDFRGLHLKLEMGESFLKIGKFIPLDTGNLFVNPFGRGYDGANLTLKRGEMYLAFSVLKGKPWVSDSTYYFNPLGTVIGPGFTADRYVMIRRIGWRAFTFTEVTVFSTGEGLFPDVSAFNPLLPGYLYQWLYGREVNVLWGIGWHGKNHTLRLVVDDFQYLPSWLSIVPPTLGVRLSGKRGRFHYDLLWISAFTFANRKPWDALLESTAYGSDYAHATFRISAGKGNISPLLEVGVKGEGRYRGVFKEPRIGEYPPFSFLHDPVRVSPWVGFGLSYGDLTVILGYGEKENSVQIGKFFLWFALLGG